MAHQQPVERTILMFESWSPEQRKAQRRRLADRNKRFIAGYKDFLGCSRCIESRAVCLEFHHIVPLNRRTSGLSKAQSNRREISSLVAQGKPLTKIVEELVKCALLCANCHKVETYGRPSCNDSQRFEVLEQGAAGKREEKAKTLSC